MAKIGITLQRPTLSFVLGAISGFAIAAAALPVTAARAADAISFTANSPWAQAVGNVSKQADFHEYTVNAGAGKTLQINLISPNPNLFFRVLPADSHKPLVDTATSGDTTWSTKSATDATYTVRVYEDPDTISGNDVTKFALQVGVF